MVRVHFGGGRQRRNNCGHGLCHGQSGSGGRFCGDSIYILDGTYHEKIIAYRVCPDAQRIVIQGDVDGRPLIIGDSTATNKYAIGASGQGFTFRHLELTSPYPDSCTASNMVVAGSGDHMTFIDIIIRNAGYDGMKTTSDCETSNWANDWKVVDCQIVNNGLGCPSSIQNGDGIDFTNCHDCLITGTTIRDNRGHQLQIKLEARNVTVEHCRIEGKWMFQIGLPGGSPQCDPTAFECRQRLFPPQHHHRQGRHQRVRFPLGRCVPSGHREQHGSERVFHFRM
jgi:hypothetical protein